MRRYKNDVSERASGKSWRTDIAATRFAWPMRERQIQKAARRIEERLLRLAEVILVQFNDGERRLNAALDAVFEGFRQCHVVQKGGSQHFAFSPAARSEEHTSELQSLMRISYAVFCLKQKNNTNNIKQQTFINTQTKQTSTHYL